MLSATLQRARRREEGEESDDENRPHALRTDFSWSSDDDEPEEGEEEEDDDDVYGGSKAKADKKKRAGKEKEVEAATKDDLQRIVIRRGRLAEFWPCSFFSDYVEGEQDAEALLESHATDTLVTKEDSQC